MNALKRGIRYLRNHFYHLRLSVKMYILIMLAVFVPLITALMLLNRYTVDAVNQRATEALANAFSQAYSVFSSRFESVQQNTTLLLLNNSARELLQEVPYNWNLLAKRTLKDQARSTIDFIENKDDPVRMRIYVSDGYDQLLDNQYYFPFSEISEASWYSELLSNPYRNMWVYSDEPSRDRSIVGVVDQLRGQRTLSYLIRVCNVEKYLETTAILRLDFSRESVEETLRQMLILDGSMAYLVDIGGDIVAEAHMGENVEFAPANLWGRSFYNTEWSVQHIGSREYHVLYRSFKGNPWTLVMMVPVSGMNTLLNDGQWNVLLMLAAVCGLLIFGASLWFSHGIISRIRLVSSNMVHVREGELKSLPEPRVRDEIGQLIESYNYLIQELQMLISAQYLAGASQKNAELKALQAQINPHFLYNTLELINYYAFCGDAASIERIVLLLSKFYKLCLNQGREFCEVWQELELTESYYEIQNMRYEGKLNLRVEVPEQLHQRQIPRIIFQPIVENAIRHGIMGRESKSGTVTISGSQDEKGILFAISDDGVGMSPSRLHELSSDPLNPPPDGSGSHYGLQNVNERFKGYYGPDYGLTFESTTGVGTTVYMRIPL